MSHLVSRLTYFSVRHWIATVVVLLLLTVAAGFFAATHFEMTTDTGALISSKVPWRQREIAINNAFPQLGDSMLIVLDAETPELAERSADRLAEKLKSDHRHFTRVMQPDGGAFFAREGLLFRTPDALRKQLDSLVSARPLLAALAADPTLRGVARTISGLFTNPSAALAAGSAGGSSGELAALAPGFADALDRVAQGKPAYFSWQKLLGGAVPPTRRLITVQPVLNNGALMPGEAATEAIRSAQNELGLGPANGVTVRLTGEVPLADEEFATLSSNVDVVGIVMLLAMVVTLWIATHSTRIVAAIVTATVAGLVVTTALGLMMVGTFNLISVAFIPLFVGLGVDFGIQISVRFAAERWYGKNTADALRHAADRLAAPLLLAAAAIFLGFGAFLPTAYVGIAQLGLIAGVGMVIAFLFSVTLLPALLMCLRPGIPPREVGFAGAEPLDRFLVRQRRFVIASFVIATIASIAMLPLLRFDFNPMHLRNPNAPAMRTLTDLTHDPDRTPNTINVLADNPQRAAALAKRLAALPEVRAAITLQDFVPEKQPAKLAMIEAAARQLAPVLQPATAPAPSDAQTIEALGEAATRLRSAAAHLPAKVAGPVGKLADAFESIATATPAVRRHAGEVVSQPLKTMLGQLRMAMQAEPVTADSLPESLQRDWQAPNGKSRIQVLPSGKSNDNQTLRRFRDAVASVTPNISGLPVATQAAASTIANAFIQAGFIALLLIGGLLYLVLRSVREVAFTLAPVVLSGFLTLATCVLIGQPINFANIIAFPLLFGVGVAFHIYFVMAWRAGATNLLQSSLARAVLFSALATGTAFGSLWLSHHPGTASMGKLLMISLGWTLVCALIFEPALLGPPPPPQERHGISPEDLEAE